MNEHTVSAAAELAGVSVRTLHHYDEIGLVRPSSRSPAGYRLYSDEDLRLLHRVVFYRELGLELTEIGDIVNDPGHTDTDHLHRQRELITERITRFTAMLTVIDEELAARRAAHAEDARQNWGDTKEFAQRQQRTARYTQQDWEKLRAELAEINRGLAEAMLAGVPATDPRAMDLAEQHRMHTDRWFHDCDHNTHRGLAEHYRANERHGMNYDDMVPGLSQYVHDAIVANAERN
jgi:DNA-binding transcriptional MerR regulator